MATNQRPLAQPPGVPPEKGIELLERQVAEAQKLLLDDAGKETPAWDRWIVVTKNHVELAFGKGAPEVSRFENSAVWSHPSNFKSKVGLFTSTLRTLVRSLAESKPRGAATRTRAGAAPAAAAGPILAVCGHHAAGQEVLRLLATTLGLPVIALDDGAHQGSSFREAVSHHAGATAFAVVVLAPDEVGGPAGTPLAAMQRRARPAAVFDLGFLFAKLGPGRVCMLLQDGVEPPSADAGLLTVALDKTGAWRQDLAKALQRAGFSLPAPA